jgi:FHA domain
LVVEAGGNETREVEHQIYSGVTLVGFSEGAKVVLKSAGVSSMHAIIQSDLDSGLTFVEDLDSTNGTSFEGGLNLIPRRMYQLLDGQIIKFGPSTCTFKTVNGSNKPNNAKESNLNIAIGTPRLGDYNHRAVSPSSPVRKDPIPVQATSAAQLGTASENFLATEVFDPKSELNSANESDGNADLADSVVLDCDESQNLAVDDVAIPEKVNDDDTSVKQTSQSETKRFYRIN